MRTAELIVYFFIAVVIGGLVLGAFKAMDYYQYHRSLRDSIQDRDKAFKVDKIHFADELAKRWKECGYGSLNKTFTVYVKDSGNLTSDFVIDRLNMINYCEDDLIDCLDKKHRFSIFNSTQIPALISVECLNHSLIVASLD